MDRKSAFRKFYQQRVNAKLRGIGWELTFEQWLAWWGEDLDDRGRGTSKLQMQRIGDSGPYRLGNIRKGYPLQNARTYSAALQNRRVEEDRLAHQAGLDAAPVVNEDIDAPEEGDESIQDYMARDRDDCFVRTPKYDRLHRC